MFYFVHKYIKISTNVCSGQARTMRTLTPEDFPDIVENQVKNEKEKMSND